MRDLGTGYESLLQAFIDKPRVLVVYRDTIGGDLLCGLLLPIWGQIDAGSISKTIRRYQGDHAS